MLDDAFHGLLLAQATRQPGAPALLDEAGATLTFAELATGIEALRTRLAGLGLGRGSRVALMAPDGPELALLFLGTTAQATAVPLNPRGDPGAMVDFLADARASVLLAPPGHEAAAALAERAGLPLLSVDGSAFSQEGLAVLGSPVGAPCPRTEPERADVAYVLGTAGTTGRSKVVPVTHAMVVASCRAMAKWLVLTRDDRCLDPMPLFHSHGLLNGLIWPLAAGGSTICPRRFDPAGLRAMLRDLHPTWTTAVPAILRAMAAALRGSLPLVGRTGLRFVRSSSAPLSPELFAELSVVFGAPVIETYGLTETGPLTTSPLAAGGQRPGKAGLPCGPEVRIVDTEGHPVPAGTSGEIVARGPTVAREYESNPAATADAFRSGWFHTGDVGRFDEEGYLVVGGRLKEIIRRGGESIAPLDVDRAIASHPTVAHCACFAIPHPTLGEEVGAAVVLAPGPGATEDEIRAHAAALLPAWMVPRVVRIVDALPRSSAGKVVRRTLAAHLGLDGPAPDAVPDVKSRAGADLSATETALLALWAAVLGRAVPTLDTDFGLAGGDSLSAVVLAGSVNEVFGTRLPLETALGDGRTVARMRDLILAERGRSDEPGDDDGPVAVPATPGQRRQWLHSLARRDEPVNTISAALLLRGPLDRQRLQRAADTVARRHDALRLAFGVETREEGRILLQHMIAEARWPVEEAPAVPRSGLKVALADAVQNPFALTAGPPRRLVLVPVADEPGTHALAVALHHAIADGWSKEIVLRDLTAAYALGPGDGDLPAAPSWLAAARRRLRQPPPETVLEAARSRLRDLTPTAWRVDVDDPDWRARRCRLALTPDVTAALRAFAKRHRVTLFTVLLTGFADALAGTLARGAGPVVLGVPLGNRAPGESQGVGPYSNATLVSVDAQPEHPVAGCSERLAAVQASILQAVSQQAVPVEVAMGATGSGAWRRAPLEIPVLVQLQAYERFRRAEAGLVLFERLAFDPGIAQADLSVEMAEENGGLVCDVASRLPPVPAASVQHLMARFVDELRRLAAGGGGRP